MDGTETITTLHFVFMALLATIVVIAIVAGVRKSRNRAHARREVQAHAEEAGIAHEPPSSETEPDPVVVPASPPPLPASPPPAGATVEAPPADPVATDPLADEPIAAAIAPDGTTATIAADAASEPEAPSPADGPVTQLKGLGPKVAARLSELGIDRVGQLAALDDARAAAIDADLGAFAGRMARDRWIEQARLLAAGDRDGFERTFGKL